MNVYNQICGIAGNEDEMKMIRPLSYHLFDYLLELQFISFHFMQVLPFSLF